MRLKPIEAAMKIKILEGVVASRDTQIKELQQ
jgi:hypothetical protein